MLELKMSVPLLADLLKTTKCGGAAFVVLGCGRSPQPKTFYFYIFFLWSFGALFYIYCFIFLFLLQGTVASTPVPRVEPCGLALRGMGVDALMGVFYSPVVNRKVALSR